MKEYKVKVIEEYDHYLCETRYQEVLNPEEKTIYSVCNMCVNVQKMRRLREI